MTVDQAAYRQNVEKIRQIAEEMDGDLLGREGWVLYSSYTTLSRGDYYFLGVNPAGSEEDHPKTVRYSLEQLVACTKDADKNQYLDISWYDDPEDKRRRPLQERFRFLFADALGVNPRSVCASNLIFKSSKKAEDAEGYPMAKKCWSFHETIIREIVKPRVIITHGSLPFDFISDKLGGKLLEKPRLCNWANWTWRCSRLEQTGQKLVGLPHLSIYDIASQSRADIVREIVKQILSD
ncbi:MAG: hypothetical protein ACLQM6_14145 [Acidobacteriaceae bacterium]